MVGNLLGPFEGAAARPVADDAGGLEDVAANPHRQIDGLGQPLDHIEGVAAVQGAGGGPPAAGGMGSYQVRQIRALLFHGLCRLGKIDWASESHQELDRCLSRAITASKNFND